MISKYEGVFNTWATNNTERNRRRGKAIPYLMAAWSIVCLGGVTTTVWTPYRTQGFSISIFGVLGGLYLVHRISLWRARLRIELEVYEMMIAVIREDLESMAQGAEVPEC